MAISEKQYKERLNVWETTFKKHTSFISESDESLQKDAAPAFHYFGLNNIEGLKNANISQKNTGGSVLYTFFLQPFVSLFAGKSFIGRTYAGHLAELDENMKVKDHDISGAFDWMVMNSKITDPKLQLVIEFMLLINKTSNQQTEEIKRYGIGYAVVPAFNEGATAAKWCELYEGSPREMLLKGEKGVKKTPISVELLT